MVGYGRILLPLELILLYLLFPSLILFGLASLEDRWVLWFLTGAYVLATLLVVRPRKQDLGLSRPHILGRVLLIAASIGAVGALWWNWLHPTNDHEGLFTAALVFVFYPGLSVPFQEFFFRSFFFQRYADLLPPGLLGLLNAFLFSFYHVIYGHLFPALAALLAGFLLAFLYLRYRDLTLCWAVHYLGGLGLYLAGFGHLFTTDSRFAN